MMTRSLLVLGVAVASLIVSAPANASPRYALVIGMNAGHLQSVELPPLRFAQQEARRVRDTLLRHGRVQPERIQLVTGGGRAGVLRAVAALEEVRREDLRVNGDLPSLLFLYFTGHGRKGTLLTADDPITSDDIEAIRGRLKTSLLVAVFDTCAAADAMPKGAEPATNPLDALPSHILDATGTIWIASASRGEVAVEDQRGGVFTRHFVNAFTDARGDPMGRSIADMFEYARARTLRDAEKLRFRQTPRIRINVEQTSPLYLSFRRDRPARVVFAPDVQGTFLLSYGDGTLLERIVKAEAVSREVAAYAGRVTIYRLKGSASKGFPFAEFHLSAGQRAVVSAATGPPPSAGSVGAVLTKGDIGLAISLEDVPHRQARIGLGYGFDPAAEVFLQAPHSARIDAWLELGAGAVGVALGYGMRGQAYPAWSFELHQVSLEAGGGYGLVREPVRLDVDAALGLLLLHQRFDTGASRTPVGAIGRLGLRLGVGFPLGRDPAVVLQLTAGAALRLVPGLSVSHDTLVATGMPYVGVVVQVPVRF